MDHQEAPTTVKEVGIHIGYMRDDLREVKRIVKDFTSTAATKEEVAALQVNADKEHEAIWDEIKGIKNSARWWVGTILVVAGLVIAIVR